MEFNIPQELQQNVLKKTTLDLSNTEIIKGYDFNEGINYEKMFKMYSNMGFQATYLGEAIEEI